MRQHVAAIGKALDLSQQHVERMSTFLTQADAQTIETLSAISPLIVGVREGGRWSIDAAAAARRIGKPVTLVVSTNGKGVEAELITGKVRISHDRD